MRKGQKHTEESKKKMSVSKKYHYVTQQTKDKIKYSLINKRKSPESILKREETNKKLRLEGKLMPWNKGLKGWTKGTDAGFQLGQKNPNWHEGINSIPYPKEYNSRSDRKLREFIRKRDNYRCQQCFRHQNELFTKKGKPIRLEVHHIDYNKNNNTPNNLISLCDNCHNQTNFNREDWTNYFKQRLGNL